MCVNVRECGNLDVATWLFQVQVCLCIGVVCAVQLLYFVVHASCGVAGVSEFWPSCIAAVHVCV